MGVTSFSGCINLEKLTLCDGLKTIDQCAFLNCPKLKNVSVPLSVTEIGFKALCMEVHNVPHDPNLPDHLQPVGTWFAPVEDAIIICKVGSKALEYAKDNDIKHIVDKPVMPIYTFKLSKTSFKYDGKVHKPKVYVHLKSGQGYEKCKITYLTPKSKKPGTYKIKVKITGKEYVLEKILKYKIKK